jgi:hypothetical protein
MVKFELSKATLATNKGDISNNDTDVYPDNEIVRLNCTTALKCAAQSNFIGIFQVAANWQAAS